MTDKIKIKQEDIEGNVYELPEGYMFKKIKTTVEKIKEIEDKIVELESIPEPTDEEYLEHGKATHPYDGSQIELDDLRRQLTELG